MKKLSLFFIIILLGCSTSQTAINQFYREGIPKVEFCELPNYKGQQVYLKCFFSGVDEYWGLSDGSKNCKEKLYVELEFKDNPFEYPKKFESVFREVHNSYWNSYLVIEAIGVFENDRKEGYGHLGSSNSRFLVSELLSATLKKK